MSSSARIVLLAAALACAPARPALATEAAALAGLLRAEVPGFTAAGRGWRFRFPADHGPHAAHRSESWRFTGNLRAPDGARFGFELTLLRLGIVPPAAPIGPSTWAARDVYWARFLVDDAASARRHGFALLERAARGMSGAERSPARVWVGDWSIAMRPRSGFGLRAAQGDVALELELRAAKSPLTRATLGGDGAGTRAPFHAYAVTRLDARGRLRLGTRDFEVEGLAWLDHAWGEVPLPVGALVWDRVLLQLDDGRDLMLVRTRRRDGSGEPSTTGLVVGRDGTTRVLAAGEASLETGERMRVRLGAESLELEARTPVRREVQAVYAWTGAVGVRGAASGEGYVEIAGGDVPSRGP
jgi:predicted secreted hydrolase